MPFGLPAESLIAAAVAALLIGIAKGGFGGGVGTVALPLLALTMPVSAAAALLLPVLIGADVFAIGHYRRKLSLPDLRLLLPAAVIGIALGAVTFDVLARHERTFEMGIGALSIAFVGWQALRSRVLRALEASPPSRALGYVFGAVAGFLSTLAHVGGPPTAMYLIPRGLPRDVYVGTTAWFFFVVNLLKLLPYFLLGLLSVSNTMLALALLPVAFVGTALGVWMNRAIGQRAFMAIIYVLLVSTGVELLMGSSLVELIVDALR